MRYGYDIDSFTVEESFTYGTTTSYDDGTSDPPDVHHLEWDREVFSLGNTSGDDYLHKMVPVPMEAFAHPDDDPDDPFVPQSRSLLIVWSVEWTGQYTRNITGQTILPTVSRHYVSRFDFTKGNYYSAWSDYEHNYYGQVIEWKMPWDIFEDTIDYIKTDIGWITPQAGSATRAGQWGDISQIPDQGDYYIYGTEKIVIKPCFFYSCQKDKLTQTVNYPAT